MKVFILIPLIFACSANAQDSASIESSATVVKVCKFIDGQSQSLNFGEIKADVSRGRASAELNFACTKGVNPNVHLSTRSLKEGYGSSPSDSMASSYLLNFDKSSKIAYLASAGVTSRSNGFGAPGVILVEALFGYEDNGGSAKPGAYSDEITIELTP